VLSCCGERPTAPTPASTLSVTFAQPLAARVVDGRAVLEFPVVIQDVGGPGGTVQSVTTIVTNRSRDIDVGRNVRPNADVSYLDTVIPAGGSLTLAAGIVFEVQPPRDEVRVSVVVTLSTGRRAEQSGSLAPLQRAAVLEDVLGDELLAAATRSEHAEADLDLRQLPQLIG
jgi:hypothetical protein